MCVGVCGCVRVHGKAWLSILGFHISWEDDGPELPGMLRRRPPGLKGALFHNGTPCFDSDLDSTHCLPAWLPGSLAAWLPPPHNRPTVVSRLPLMRSEWLQHVVLILVLGFFFLRGFAFSQSCCRGFGTECALLLCKDKECERTNNTVPPRWSCRLKGG